MKGISSVIATVLLVLVALLAAGGYYVYIANTSNTILKSASEGIIYPETPPQIGTVFCYPGYGWVEAIDTSGSGINGTINYKVTVDGTIKLGSASVAITESGKIYFAVPGTAGQTVKIVFSAPKWSVSTSCTARRDPDLLIHYSFDKGAGTTAIDRSGNNAAGMIDGASWVTGLSGYALSFDGSDNAVESYPATGNIDNELTVSLWLKPANYSGSSIAEPIRHEYKDATDSGGYLLSWRGDSDNRWDMGIRQSDGTSRYPYRPTTTDVPVDQWTFLAFTATGTNVSTYLNGVYNASTTSDGTIGNGRSLLLGAYAVNGGAKSRFFNGTIDELRIYDRALSAQEIQSLYTAFE